MKKSVLIITVALLFSSLTFSQNVPANIILYEGQPIQAYHFGQKECNGNEQYMGYIMLKGKYMGQVTEMKDYTNISKMELEGFTKEPENSTGNEKGKIIVHKKNGLIVTLTDAELIQSCMGSDEKYNQIKVQVINPLTEKIFEKSISIIDIKAIIFQ